MSPLPFHRTPDLYNDDSVKRRFNVNFSPYVEWHLIINQSALLLRSQSSVSWPKQARLRSCSLVIRDWAERMHTMHGQSTVYRILQRRSYTLASRVQAYCS